MPSHASRGPRRPLHCALLGLTHPHSAALLAALERVPAIGRVTLWAEDRGARLPVAGKADGISADLDAVLGEPTVDFALVCLRPDRSAAVARRVIAAGRHLLTEKPAGLTAAEIGGLVRAAERAGVLAAVLYPNRLHPVATEARRLCRAGALGPLLSLEARCLTTQVRFRDPRSWLFRHRQAGGGILTWLGCHYLDLLQHVSGDDIVAVAATLARRSGEAIDVEDAAALTLQFRSGAVGTFHAGYALAFSGGGYMNPAGNDAYLAWNGRDGRLVWPDPLQPRLHLELPGPRPVRTRSFRLAPGATAGSHCREAVIRRFAAAVRGREENPIPLAAAWRTARLLEAAARAQATGRRVPVASPAS
ncbi:MAG: Gfo/Idh/MocA family oxidoreductase [Opitutaceae bacterium]|nr:Gfo/Idh/MocA family oxidoreductase [Opitutaceae bacterium]